MKTRAFIAIDIPESIKGKIYTPEIENAKISGKQLHITLIFLGYVDENEIEEIKKIISSLKQKPFLVSLKGMGFFASGSHGVVFANVEKGKEEITGIYAEITDRLGSQASKEFIPHVTVLRLKNIKSKKEIIEKLARMKNDAFGSFLCNEIKLKKSTLGRDGAVYEDLFVKELH
ncbi:MAG: RNA 2',3'-cyclic phosphodiesterase [Candidatus Marsarchaeota archaeon]|nr:RNA 2',3'-cyclic phosphodiesterase [Candidatus Marsarchaeota archaeon]